MPDSGPVVLIGYLAVSPQAERPGVLSPFLMRVAQLHREREFPFTLFVRGKLIEPLQADFQRVRDLCGELVDFEQAAWDGRPLKTVCRENHRGVKVVPAGDVEACMAGIARTMDAMDRVLGERPPGLAAPLGYYRGLSDRPDLLYRLHALGVRFVRSWTRNARDWSPVPFETQPFFYEPQGFAEMLEIPGQGEFAIEECEAGLRRNGERFLHHVQKDLDYVTAKKLTWSLVQHDWCAMMDDPEMRITASVLDHIRQRDIEPLTHRGLYERVRAQGKQTTD